MNRAQKTLTIAAKAPDSRGSFDGVVLYNPVDGDLDGERVDSWRNLPKTVELRYAHAKSARPIGRIKARLEPGGRLMSLHGQLDLSDTIARAVYEKMLLPSSDPECLSELSLGFTYLASLNTKDASGVVAIHEADLIEVSVVRAGAQATLVSNLKSHDDEIARLNAMLDALAPTPDDLAALNARLDAAAPTSVLDDLNRRLDAISPPPRQPSQHRLAQLAAINNQAVLSRPIPPLDPRDMSEIL